MTQRLHLVFGGDLVYPSDTVFMDVIDMHVVGMFADFHRLLDADQPGAGTEKTGA